MGNQKIKFVLAIVFLSLLFVIFNNFFFSEYKALKKNCDAVREKSLFLRDAVLLFKGFKENYFVMDGKKFVAFSENSLFFSSCVLEYEESSKKIINIEWLND